MVKVAASESSRDLEQVRRHVDSVRELIGHRFSQRGFAKTALCSCVFDCARTLMTLGDYEEALRVWRDAAECDSGWINSLGVRRARFAMATYLQSSVVLGRQWAPPKGWVGFLLESNRHASVAVATSGFGDAFEVLKGHRGVPLIMLAGKELSSVPGALIYEVLAAEKGMGTQVYRVREAQVSSSDRNVLQEAKKLADELMWDRSESHRLLFRTRPAGLDVAGRIERPVREGKEKRSLERESWTELRRQLDDRQAFVDFYYVPEAITGTAQYHVFIVQKDRPLIHVELGDGAVINDAIERWQEAMDDPEAERQWARVLYERIWKPVSVALGPSIDTLFVSPDERLSELPWAALPIAPDDAVLLERYAVATVPYGDYLRQQLVERREKAERETGGPWLLVGDVDFNRAADDRQGDTRTLAGHRRWDPLPYTRWEIRRIGDLVEPQAVRQLAGAEATPENVLAGLTDAQYVHIATHGFFADDELRKALGYGESLELEDVRRKLEKVRLQLPFALSGLVLAGANRPVPMAADGTPLGDGGLLTASSIASLDLDHVELVVLSACETARGTLLVGEGAFALPRAFQVAGARNVVATYWEVDDQASAALMNLFYHYLIVENESPLQALRRAQLRLRDTPQPLAELATLRGPNLREGAKPLETTHGSAAAPTRRPTRLWAGYGLFGVGR